VRFQFNKGYAALFWRIMNEKSISFEGISRIYLIIFSVIRKQPAQAATVGERFRQLAFFSRFF